MSFFVTASIVIVVIAAIILLYLGLKYPQGRTDWPHDGYKTFRFIISGILFLIILGLIYWITRYWDYPLSGKGLVYVAFFALFVLFILGIIFPKGRKFTQR